jgi:hypothetical protein
MENGPIIECRKKIEPFIAPVDFNFAFKYTRDNWHMLKMINSLPGKNIK